MVGSKMNKRKLLIDAVSKIDDEIEETKEKLRSLDFLKHQNFS